VRGPQGGQLALPYRWQWRVERLKSTVRGFFGGGDKQPRPKICPACGALVGINVTRCHECGANLRFSLAALSRGLSGFFGGRAPVTTALLIMNILMFGISWVATTSAGEGGGLSILWGLGGETLYRLGSSYGPAIFFQNEWYRLVTAMFLHGGLIHIGFNMMVLMDIGPVVEEVYGSARYLFLYTATGAAGFLLSAWRGHLSVGASGALLGLIGVMIAITMKRGGASMQALRSRLMSWVVSIFVFGFLLKGVDNWAHFGGLAAGFGLGKVLMDREPMTPTERTRAYALGWLAGIVIVVSFVFMVLHYRDALPGT
jgi:rhomboid protease GluP